MSDAPRDWLFDPTGLMTALGAQFTTLEEAMSLNRYVVQSGQVIVSLRDGCAGMFGTNEYSVFFSLFLEERTGVDLRARYAEVLGLGPSSTQYGDAIATSVDRVTRFDPAAAQFWTERLAAAGLRVIDRGSYERAHGKSPPGGEAYINFPTSEFGEPPPR